MEFDRELPVQMCFCSFILIIIIASFLFKGVVFSGIALLLFTYSSELTVKPKKITNKVLTAPYCIADFNKNMQLMANPVCFPLVFHILEASALHCAFKAVFLKLSNNLKIK